MAAIRRFLSSMYGRSSSYIVYCPLYGRCPLFGESAKRGSTVCVICRAKTSIQQKLPAQLEEKLEKFVTNIRVLREAHSFPDAMVINMDETPLYFDMPGSHTVHRKGCREVRIRSTGAEKRRLTIILACTAAGDMLPMLIFKGKRALKTLQIPAGVIVAVQPKAWNDVALTKIWIQKVLCRYTQK